jgi:hypothetical protein
VIALAVEADAPLILIDPFPPSFHASVFLGEIPVSSDRLHFSPDPPMVPDPGGSVTGPVPNVVPVYRGFRICRV